MKYHDTYVITKSSKKKIIVASIINMPEAYYSIYAVL